MFSTQGVLLTMFAGSFFFIGALLNNFVRKKEALQYFALGLALATTTMILSFDLLPHTFEKLDSFSNGVQIFATFAFIVAGFLILKILDSFIPHHHECGDKRMYHIGLVVTAGLILHNVIEGFMIYSLSLTDVAAALLFAVAIGLHHLPLGMHVSSMMKAGKVSKLKEFGILSILAFSGLLGAFSLILLDNNISEGTLGGVMAVAIGMLIYIILFELLSGIIKCSNKKIAILGVVVGTTLFILSHLLVH